MRAPAADRQHVIKLVRLDAGGHAERERFRRDQDVAHRHHVVDDLDDLRGPDRAGVFPVVAEQLAGSARRGSHRPCSPPAIRISLPARASFGLPLTGQSTTAIPLAAAASAACRIVCGSMVLSSMQSVPLAAWATMPLAPSQASVTAFGSGRLVSTIARPVERFGDARCHPKAVLGEARALIGVDVIADDVEVGLPQSPRHPRSHLPHSDDRDLLRHAFSPDFFVARSCRAIAEADSSIDSIQRRRCQGDGAAPQAAQRRAPMPHDENCRQFGVRALASVQFGRPPPRCARPPACIGSTDDQRERNLRQPVPFAAMCERP